MSDERRAEVLAEVRERIAAAGETGWCTVSREFLERVEKALAQEHADHRLLESVRCGNVLKHREKAVIVYNADWYKSSCEDEVRRFEAERKMEEDIKRFAEKQNIDQDGRNWLKAFAAISLLVAENEEAEHED